MALNLRLGSKNIGKAIIYNEARAANANTPLTA
eukprot:CAMPEP_0115754968 /NCGR_PEP_ID=MMETSP0272-20121206/97142_1 /TAXON_ID=71861 /ORGANISM="Scrippsiella trochoidea, Strain CCMP3099" /LENGTH=32 /DNA_ID= /DNA_START= /DNA_END= /DNA_ORIENTATION=